jgi:hypothetical protein
MMHDGALDLKPVIVHRMILRDCENPILSDFFRRD